MIAQRVGNNSHHKKILVPQKIGRIGGGAQNQGSSGDCLFKGDKLSL